MVINMERNKNVNKIVTDNIISLIESGKLPEWSKAFKRIKRNIDSKKNYSCLNQLLLSGDTSEYYITSKKAIAKKLNFKGAKTKIVTFWKVSSYMAKNVKTNELEEKKSFLLRFYNVIGFDSIANTEEKRKLIEKKSEYKNNVRLEELDKMIANIGATIKTGQSGMAYYSPSAHEISLPKIETFTDSKSYYKTLFHELAHWTGHETNLKRHNEKKYTFEEREERKQEYSYEELVAEISSAMLAEYFNLNDNIDDLKNSASYLKAWLEPFKNDVNMIVHASSKADKAVNFILDKMGVAPLAIDEA